MDRVMRSSSARLRMSSFSHGFDPAALASYLLGAIPELAGNMRLQRIGGGQSNPTFFVSFDRGRELVLRKQPPGELLKSAHAIDREYRVQLALRTVGFPVPPALLFCSDRSVIGTPFYVMERLHGRVLSDYALDNVDAKDRRAYLFELAETLARLHAVDWAAIGLADYGRPGNFFDRQITRWTRQWHATKLHDTDDMNLLMEWLPSHIPSGDETTIAHGDYRLGNVMFHPTQPKIIAVLDWELSTLGHPLADAAYSCLPWNTDREVFEGLRGLDLAQGGLPTQSEYLAHYQRCSGREAVQPFHIVFSLFRFAAILEGISARVRGGNAAGEDAAEVGALSSRFARYAVDIVRAEG